MEKDIHDVEMPGLDHYAASEEKVPATEKSQETIVQEIDVNSQVAGFAENLCVICTCMYTVHMHVHCTHTCTNASERT